LHSRCPVRNEAEATTEFNEETVRNSFQDWRRLRAVLGCGMQDAGYEMRDT